MADLDIADLMAPLGPFERNPRIAVAVSGGSDSLGLGLLLAEWVRGGGGSLHVLAVDHGLRPEAAGECEVVRSIFAAIPSCSAHILRWEGSKPTRRLQAEARRARYALLTDWCRANGVLHLAVGHTADDQAETVTMRGAHGSGDTGLAGMAALRPVDGVRLLRPLLTVSRGQVRAWLERRGQAWIDDPSNALTKFERVRVRQNLGAEEAERACALSWQLGRARDEKERAAARLLAEAGQIHDAGYVSVDFETLLRTETPVLEAVLRLLFPAISGRDYAPMLGPILRLLFPATTETEHRATSLDLLTRAGTLGGCLVQVSRRRLHIFREAASIGGRVPVAPGWAGPWDNRFALGVAGGLSPVEGWSIGPLGADGLAQASRRFGISLKRHPIPLPARLALPALWRRDHWGEHLVAQPHLKLGEGLAARLAPRHTVATCGFTVAAGRPHTIYSSTRC